MRSFVAAAALLFAVTRSGAEMPCCGALARSGSVSSLLPPALSLALARTDPALLADTALPRLADLGPAARDELYDRLAGWPVARRVAALAFLQTGTPYVLGPLGEAAPPDTDPLIRFDAADCATVNLIAEALAHARTSADEASCMTLANYRGGIVSYATRLHFTTDRLDVSPYDRDITRRVGGRAAKMQHVMLNRKLDGSRWIKIDWERARDVSYLPMRSVADFPRLFRSRRIPEAMGVAFVQADKLKDGLDVVHESLLWQGRLLLHGSSRIGRVTTIPWSDFLRERGKYYDGVVLFEYR